MDTNIDAQTPLKVLALTCSLKASPAESSTDLMAGQILEELKKHAVEGEMIRVADHDVKPGVETDMGNGDAWPQLRQKMLEADILLLATPTWMGNPSSIAYKILERLDAELSETDDNGNLLTYGKVAIVAAVGNEDGAHKICADLFQALNDVGFTIPAAAAVYWNGEAMHTVDYKDLAQTPEKVVSSIKTVASHAAHAARLLKRSPYLPID